MLLASVKLFLPGSNNKEAFTEAGFLQDNALTKHCAHIQFYFQPYYKIT